MDTLTADRLAEALQEPKKSLLAKVLRTPGPGAVRRFHRGLHHRGEWWHADQRWRSPADPWRDLLPPGTAAVQQTGTRPALSVPVCEASTEAGPTGAA